MTTVVQSRGEEIANTVSHGLGFIAALAAIPILIVGAVHRGDAGTIVGGAVFGSSMALLYLASTLYHAAPQGKTKSLLRKLDHSAIYLLIAGTYTPFALAPLRGGLGWTILGAIWGSALLGIAFKVFFTGRFKAVSLISYLFMGWFCIIAVKPLYRELNTAGFVFLAVGGLCYTVGAIFYAWKALPWSHTIWHLFVLAGSLCHFFSILFGIAL